MANELSITASKTVENQITIWVIKGYTKPFTQTLLQAGAVWNAPKIRWEFHGDSLPAAIRDAIAGLKQIDPAAVSPVSEKQPAKPKQEKQPKASGKGEQTTINCPCGWTVTAKKSAATQAYYEHRATCDKCDYLLRKDSGYGMEIIWGTKADIEPLTWIEKRNYLKQRFASDENTLLVTMVGHNYHFMLGTDASQAYEALKDHFDGLTYMPNTEHGAFLTISRGNPVGKLIEHGYRIIEYFAGTHDQSIKHDYEGAKAFAEKTIEQYREAISRSTVTCTCGWTLTAKNQQAIEALGDHLKTCDHKGDPEPRPIGKMEEWGEAVRAQEAKAREAIAAGSPDAVEEIAKAAEVGHQRPTIKYGDWVSVEGKGESLYQVNSIYGDRIQTILERNDWGQPTKCEMWPLSAVTVRQPVGIQEYPELTTGITVKVKESGEVGRVVSITPITVEVDGQERRLTSNEIESYSEPEQKPAFAPKPTVTPLRQQYLDFKREYPDAILLFQLGDFFEAFDEDAEIIARELELVLTGRPINRTERTPMAGFPIHAKAKYVDKLIAKGFKVAVCEQVGESQPGRTAERKVTDVLNPLRPYQAYEEDAPDYEWGSAPRQVFIKHQVEQGNLSEKTDDTPVEISLPDDQSERIIQAVEGIASVIAEVRREQHKPAKGFKKGELLRSRHENYPNMLGRVIADQTSGVVRVVLLDDQLQPTETKRFTRKRGQITGSETVPNEVDWIPYFCDPVPETPVPPNSPVIVSSPSGEYRGVYLDRASGPEDPFGAVQYDDGHISRVPIELIRPDTSPNHEICSNCRKAAMYVIWRDGKPYCEECIPQPEKPKETCVRCGKSPVSAWVFGDAYCDACLQPHRPEDETDKWVKKVNHLAREIDEWADTMHPSGHQEALAPLMQQYIQTASGGKLKSVDELVQTVQERGWPATAEMSAASWNTLEELGAISADENPAVQQVLLLKPEFVRLLNKVEVTPEKQIEIDVRPGKLRLYVDGGDDPIGSINAISSQYFSCRTSLFALKNAVETFTDTIKLTMREHILNVDSQNTNGVFNLWAQPD